MPERRKQVEAIYQEALDRPREDRRGFLAEACGDDSQLRDEVETLLAHFDQAGSSFLQTPAHGLGALEPSPTPDNIAGFSIQATLGEGGMGTVYRAEQLHPKRQVALKVIRGGFMHEDVRRRFDLEARVLARLRHPGIAQVHAAGTYERAGERYPYFAMELVEGLPLLAYAEHGRLGLSARLELLARVCDAVQHAHQHGVIHRDLKPSNILVEPGGQVKVLDFGVARLSERGAGETQHTRAGEFVGTLPYMSPEQVQGDPEALDTRSDVYALGVLAFELLTGVLPYSVAKVSLPEATRIITEQEPRRMSSTSCTTGIAPAALRGDPQTIVSKALEKLPGRRYASAAEMAADLRRALHHEPLSAHPPSLGYQLSKFARRRRGLVTSVALVLLAVVGGAVAATWQAYRALQAEQLARSETRRALEAEQLARSEARRAEAVRDFLNDDLLGQANPFNQPERDLPLRSVLDRAAERVAGQFATQPRVAAELRQTLGEAYYGLGLYDEAEEQLVESLALFRSAVGDDALPTIEVLLTLGDVRRLGNDLPGAAEVWEEAGRAARNALGPDHPLALQARSDLGMLAIAENRLEDAVGLVEPVLATRRQVLGASNGATLVSMNMLGSLYERLGRYDEAEPLYRECVARSRASLGNEHPDTLNALNNLSLFLTRQDRLDEAESLSVEVLETRLRVLGEEHAMTLASINNLGFFYSRQQRYDECRPLYEQAYEIRRRLLGVAHPDTQLSMSNLAWLYGKMERFDEAEALIVELLEVVQRVAPDSLDLAYALQLYSGFLVGREMGEAALPVAEEAVAASHKHFPEGHWRIGGALLRYGDCLRLLERYDEAEETLLDAHERIATSLGDAHQTTAAAVRSLVTLYEAWGREEQADVWRGRLGG